MRPDAGAVQKRHPELDAPLLGQKQQPLPDAQVGPADEGLRRPRPGTQLSRNGAPLGPVLMPPDNGRNRAPQILGRGLALGPARLDQRLQLHPVRVRQHRPLLSPGGANRPSSQTVQARTGPNQVEKVSVEILATFKSPFRKAAIASASDLERQRATTLGSSVMGEMYLV